MQKVFGCGSDMYVRPLLLELKKTYFFFLSPLIGDSTYHRMGGFPKGPLFL